MQTPTSTAPSCSKTYTDVPPHWRLMPHGKPLVLTVRNLSDWLQSWCPSHTYKFQTDQELFPASRELPLGSALLTSSGQTSLAADFS